VFDAAPREVKSKSRWSDVRFKRSAQPHVLSSPNQRRPQRCWVIGERGGQAVHPINSVLAYRQYICRLSLSAFCRATRASTAREYGVHHRVRGNSGLVRQKKLPPPFSAPTRMACVQAILLLFFLLWLANRAALQAMDQPFPPRPALFLRLMLMLKPSRFKQLFSNLWVTHPILQTLKRLVASIFSDTQRSHKCARQAPIRSMEQLYADCGRNARAFGVTVEIRRVRSEPWS
jgi:hypothetical protein